MRSKDGLSNSRSSLDKTQGSRNSGPQGLDSNNSPVPK